MFDITEVLNLLIKFVFSGLGILLTWAINTYVIPWIKANVSTKQMETFKSYIFVLIRSAEQLQSNGYFADAVSAQEAKKEYVLKAAKERAEKWGFTFDEEEISNLIEGLIKEAKNDLKESVK